MLTIRPIELTRDHPALPEVLNSEAAQLLAELHRRFEPVRRELLARREARQAELAAGARFVFPTETAAVRAGEWRVAPTPPDLLDRRVEITGPCERKMLINALNSGARAFMADCEDAQSPTWDNQLQGQLNLSAAIRRTIGFVQPETGKEYRLNERVATLLVRPRGWHLDEKHVRVDGQPIAGALFDFGLYFLRNARELIARGSGPYCYLPKLESYLEARLWNDVFIFLQDWLGLPRGTIRATMLIETIHAAYQMDEFLYELRDHAAGLNAGRWDYIFSCIKSQQQTATVFPDRAQITMTVPFMAAYTELLVRTCHQRGAHAIGGMAAFIPNRKDPEVTTRALAKVRADKSREAGQGFDGSWVAHPDLVPVAMEEFDRVLGARPHQKERLREDVAVTAAQLCDFAVPGGTITEAGVRENISVGLQYLVAWLNGNGAAAINNLMEDVATAEISRAQLWQWLHKGARLVDGRAVDTALYARLRDEEIARLGADRPRLGEARELMDRFVQAKTCANFLTLSAYERLV